MVISEKWTDRFVKSIPATDKRREISVGGHDGLVLVVQPSGAKSWAWRGRHAITKKHSKQTLAGRYPHTSYADATEWAARLNAAKAQGIDLKAEERAQAEAAAAIERAAQEHTTKTLDWFWTEHYRPRHVDRLKDRAETIRQYEKLIKPKLGSKPLRDIEHDDLAGIVAAVRLHAPVTANRVVTMLRTMWKRALSDFRTETGLRLNAAEYLVKPTKEESRERTLALVEHGLALNVIDALAAKEGRGYLAVYARGLKLIALTGCRLSEAFGAKWSEFDFEAGSWEQPGKKTKNGQPNLLVLPPATMDWLLAMKTATTSKYLFTTKDTSKPLTGFSKAKAELIAEVEQAGKSADIVIENWTPHDLRRTVSTELRGITEPGSLNAMVPDSVVEALLNHIEGASKKGVAGVYNRYRYRREKAEALIVWHDYLERARKAAKKVMDAA